MNNDKITGIFGGPENKVTNNNFTFTVSRSEAMTMKVPKYAGHFVVDAYRTPKGYFVTIECNNNEGVKADFTISGVASGDGCKPSLFATQANNPHCSLAEKPTYKQLEEERDQLAHELSMHEPSTNKLADLAAYCVQRNIGQIGQKAHEAMIAHCEALQTELFNARQERDALAAQNELLRSHLETFSEIDGGFEAAMFESKWREIIRATPEHCLAEIRAEAGRAGFMAGYAQHESDADCGIRFRAEKMSSEYAAQIRQGGKK